MVVWLRAPDSDSGDQDCDQQGHPGENWSVLTGVALLGELIARRQQSPGWYLSPRKAVLIQNVMVCAEII